MVRAALARRPAVSFVLVAFLISWGIWIPATQLFSTVGPQFAAMVIGSFGPAIAAMVVVVATGGALRSWVRDMVRWRLPFRWYLAALGLPVLFVAIETIVYATVVGPVEPATLPQRVAVWAGAFVFALVLTGGNEEPGWRGFLQPQLQRSYGALIAALIVGVVWTVWHFPLDLLMPPELDGGGYDTADALSRLATLPLAVIYAWLYNSTDGSVLVTMLFHAGWNTSQTLVPVPLPGETDVEPMGASLVLTGTRIAVMLVVLVAVLVVYDRETLATGSAHRQPETALPEL